MERLYENRDGSMKELLESMTIDDVEFISDCFGIAFPASNGYIGYEVGGM